MQIPVVVEQVAGNGYRARAGEPFAVTVEGATHAEALEKLRESIEGRIAAGIQVVSLEIPTTDDPWLAMRGIFKDDPLFDEWQRAIAEYRRQVDQDPNVR
ncbi:MAG: hypothetical protein K2R98_16870 [Gemmataceae bacterium]|nr:hypothetical protein [Gemmataceae bacterium]